MSAAKGSNTLASYPFASTLETTMSRAYRIAVREGVQRVIRGEDCVSSQLELLEILPREEMAALLVRELIARGFAKDGDVVVRKTENETVVVDPKTGEVSVSSELSEEVNVESERVRTGYDDMGPGRDDMERRERESLREELGKEVERREEALRRKTTDELEKTLGDLRSELDQVVNRVTGEALKQKAARLGNVKRISQNDETGDMEIIVEV
jgi:hypothetical protein